MKTLLELKLQESPEFIQEQIARELLEEEDEDITSLNLVFVEFDPSEPIDLAILKDHLSDKIGEEGEPDLSQVDEIGISGEIQDPILIIDGTCREGRHRIAASIKYELKIKAYCV